MECFASRMVTMLQFQLPCPITLTFDISGSVFGDGNPLLMSDSLFPSYSYTLKKHFTPSSAPWAHFSLFLAALDGSGPVFPAAFGSRWPGAPAGSALALI